MRSASSLPSEGKAKAPEIESAAEYRPALDV